MAKLIRLVPTAAVQAVQLDVINAVIFFSGLWLIWRWRRHEDRECILGYIWTSCSLGEEKKGGPTVDSSVLLMM